MRRIVVFAVTFAAMVMVAAPAAGASTVPANSNAFGDSHAGWARSWGDWAFGDASNPLFASLDPGTCGQMVGRAYFIAAPIDVNLELDCAVPAGVPIVFTHAGTFSIGGIDANTDEELESLALGWFTPIPASNMLTLDGQSLPLITTETGAYDVTSEGGSFLDVVFGLTGEVRIALVGQFTVLRPLRPGDHELYGAVAFPGDVGGAFSATYHLHVG